MVICISFDNGGIIMKYAGDTFYLVIYEGEIVDVSGDDDEAESIANGINDRNVNSEVRGAGYDPEELTADEMAGFAFSAGFNGGYAYYEAITIPEEPDEDNEDTEVETEDSVVYTSGGDEFTYRDIINAIDEAIAAEEFEDNEDNGEDDEDYDDEDCEE